MCGIGLIYRALILVPGMFHATEASILGVECTRMKHIYWSSLVFILYN